jgi:hypothetical protein
MVIYSCAYFPHSQIQTVIKMVHITSKFRTIAIFVIFNMYK